MYLKKFQIKNDLDKEIYSINFTDEKNRIKKWSMIQETDPSEDLLVLKLISVCLGGGNNYFTSLGKEVTKKLIKDNKPIYWGIELYGDNLKTVLIQFRTLPDGRIEPVLKKRNFGSNVTVSKGFNDIKKPLGSFAYGYNPPGNNIVQSDPDKDFSPRVRSSRFETMFREWDKISYSFLGDRMLSNELQNQEVQVIYPTPLNNLFFPLNPVDEWLYRQYVNASQYQSKKAEYLYNISLSLITEVFPDIFFSHWEKDNKIYFKKGSNIYPYLKLPPDYILLINFLSVPIH
ncbi:hypothetical protein H8E88_30155 [candidate division KSB1 bacterium]|nr:hypothetical protein [candidate division KSB1 bacterium]